MLLHTANKRGHLAPAVPKGFTLVFFAGKKQYLHSIHFLKESNELLKKTPKAMAGLCCLGSEPHPQIVRKPTPMEC